MLSTLLTLVLTSPATIQEPADAPVVLRMVDLDGDGLRDRLCRGPEGALTIAMNRGARVFEETNQALPGMPIASVVVDDLDGDGFVDLYLVSPGPNAVLVGDGTGRFADATTELGLEDAGPGLEAERTDLDGDGAVDLLLHNAERDVVFWRLPDGRYERDALTPEDSARTVTGAALPDPPTTQADEPTAPLPGGRRSSRRLLPEATDARPPGGPQVAPAVAALPCSPAIEDVSTGDCISASSTPTLGCLYPLGQELFIDGSTGYVGMNTTAPADRLHVQDGIVRVGEASDTWSARMGPGYAATYYEDSPVAQISVGGDNEGYLNLTCPIGLGGIEGFGTEQPYLWFHREWNIVAEIGGGSTEGFLKLAEMDGTRSIDLGTPGLLAYDGADQETLRLDRATGDASQANAADGLVKAACHVDGTGGASVTRQFNNLQGGGTITVTRVTPGNFAVDFGTDVSGRFFSATLGTSGGGGIALAGEIQVTPRSSNVNQAYVVMWDNTTSSFIDNDFYLLVY